MASLRRIRVALQELISPTIEGVSCYANIVANPNLPALVIAPTDINFKRAFGRGNDVHHLDIYLLFPLSDYDVAQVALDDYVTGAGDKSIRELVFNNQSLGLVDANGAPDAVAWVTDMQDYGGQFQAAGIPHLGARLLVEVHTSGEA